jgi:Uncharacterized protein conserved in archaea
MTDEADVDQSKRATLRRFAALGAASPLIGLAGASKSESDTPEAIVGYLSATPGAHFSKLRDDLKLGTGETQHHLRQLESEAMIESGKDGDYRRYFPAGRFDTFQQTALGALRRETPRRMLIALFEGTHSPAAIADQIGVSRPTISRHTAELEDSGLLVREPVYRVVDPETVLLLVVRYADSFGAAAARLASRAPDLLEYTPESTPDE